MANKYFTLEKIKDAVERLRKCDRKWLLIPLVLGANGVDTASATDLSANLGTDKYLKRFFNSALIDLEPKKPGKQSSVTPLFADLVADQPDHIAKQTDGLMWANNFSVSGAGYGKLRDGQILLDLKGSEFQLGPKFAKWFRDAIPKEFRFEDLLTWFYAFSGFPDEINSWKELFDHFLKNETAQNGFPAPYQSVFQLTPGEPWPTSFLNKRPTNKEFQDLLLPGVSKCEINPSEFDLLRGALADLLKSHYLGFQASDLEGLALSIVSGLQSCRRVFLLGEPGTGKTQLGLLVSTAFDQVFGSRVHTVFAPIADGTTPDKLIGFSTLDGRWIDGMLTQKDDATQRQLLYAIEPGATLKQFQREQINVVLLDEVNRRDAEDLLSKLQNALDSEHLLPEHISNQVKLDNAGERYLSPNTFLIMSGNSPRDDSGRLVQSRPFKRRHNLVVVRNAFETLLDLDATQFAAALVALWGKRGTNFVIEDAKAKAFSDAVGSEAAAAGALLATLKAMRGFAVGLSYGLAKKLLQTAGARFAMAGNFGDSLDHALTESVLPLLSSEVVTEGKGVRESLLAVDPVVRGQLPTFFKAVQEVLSPPDTFGRPRQFL